MGFSSCCSLPTLTLRLPSNRYTEMRPSHWILAACVLAFSSCGSFLAQVTRPESVNPLPGNISTRRMVRAADLEDRGVIGLRVIKPQVLVIIGVVLPEHGQQRLLQPGAVQLNIRRAVQRRALHSAVGAASFHHLPASG